ncbi:MAG TPA: hypothetical protein VFV95_18295 [Vicinamibacterales bacterium]|nr:hypothetical protein [Vicinamibacterales bacterium]
MDHLPVAVRSALRRLARRLAVGVFLDVWPPWAVGSLLLAGVVALVCRLLVPAAAPVLAWLWLAPILAALPALALCALRAYRPEQVLAIADSLSGGHGLLLALAERRDTSWSASPLLERIAALPMPRLQPLRRLSILVPALAFLWAALLLPQREAPRAAQAVLADQVVNELAATIVALKTNDLITPEEEKKLEEELERVRKSASERVDSSSWEAADALKERVAADVAEKRDALKWAQESLARYAAAAQAGANDPAGEVAAAGEGAELMKALSKLAESGMLSNAPASLKALAAGRVALPADAESLRRLQSTLAEFLGEQSEKFGDLAALGKEFGRFDPAEFPLESGSTGFDGDANPGNGGVSRGRADAPLTWGREALPFDRFKAQPLPPGHVRNPDDWAPMVVMPGTPSEQPQSSATGAARTYAAGAGQEAWRRTLAPRHQSAVRKYFEK